MRDVAEGSREHREDQVLGVGPRIPVLCDETALCELLAGLDLDHLVDAVHAHHLAVREGAPDGGGRKIGGDGRQALLEDGEHAIR